MSHEVATGSRPVANARVEVAAEVAEVAERWIVALDARLRRDARLRHRRFSSLAALNAAIHALGDEINTHVMRRHGASRAHLFASLHCLPLRPPPETACVFARWKRCKVAPDDHV